MRTRTSPVALLVLVGLLLAACGQATPEPTAEPTAAPTEEVVSGEGFLICEITGAMGTSGDSLNAAVWDGLQDAQAGLGVGTQSMDVSNPGGEQGGIDELIADGCDMVVALGSGFDDAVESSAGDHPELSFVLFSETAQFSLDNVRVQWFRPEEAAFIAGYLAAGTSSTGKVGIFGGSQDSSVISIMSAFEDGLDYYNEENSATTTLLGWSTADGEGMFVDSTDAEGVQAATASLLDEGAEVVMSVAGPAAVEPVLDNGQAYIIGYPTDWARIAPNYVNVVLTSVIFHADDIVQAAIEGLIDGSFQGGTFLGDMTDGSVGLGSVSIRAPAGSADVGGWIDDLKAEVRELRNAAESGELQVSD